MSLKQYLAEAYIVLSHIDQLNRMLESIRKPYLDIDTVPSFLTHASRSPDPQSSSNPWENITHLSNEQRDQFDIQARQILSRCANRVKELETVEKLRQQTTTVKSPLARFLPARLASPAVLSETSASDFIAAHHASITWYLNRRLARASQIQRDMQEERINRQLGRAKTLGSGAAREALTMGLDGTNISSPNGSTRPQDSGSRSGLASSLSRFTSLPSAAYPTPPPQSYQPEDEDSEPEEELTQAQIQQFESENAALLRGLQTTLAAVQKAESSLLDIAALQTELVTHLTQQTEITDQLYDDAIASSSTVERANVQLREARRRGKDSRLFILVFLIGSSFALLFLHYY
ncbi:hypothetical protein SISSUDRAFT_979048 [Sistotremastrum suecicum HHB10207 ss-3]|uniref:SNARE-complex protein Syntaxin-18 N-terminal domain-containing protein n=1 Tax=Sistotremastrum suecicum HHB10207 ss-3 TaxID=1314776 RepID=A0A166HMH6_9AGAM|nr:hypothetical protein SISSUDRAFT_979048 [Sistotremastrum suecicum HHB10207 ss-3]